MEIYGLLLKRIGSKRPGDRLWQNNDLRIDRGETLSDGSTNVVWQRQRQTKKPALKKIDTHTKIVVQKVFPNSRAGELWEEFYRKLG